MGFVLSVGPAQFPPCCAVFLDSFLPSADVLGMNYAELTAHVTEPRAVIAENKFHLRMRAVQAGVPSAGITAVVSDTDAIFAAMVADIDAAFNGFGSAFGWH